MARPTPSPVSVKPKAPTPPVQATSANQGEEAVRAQKAKNGTGADPIRDAVRKELDQKVKPKLEKALAGNPQALKQIRPLLQTVESGIIDTVKTLSRTAAAKVPLSNSELQKVDRDMAMGLVAAIDQQGVPGLAAVAGEVAKMQSTVASPAPSPRAGQPKVYNGTDVVPDVSGTAKLGQLTLFDTNAGVGVTSLVPLWTAWDRGQQASNPADRDRASWGEIGKVLFPVASKPQVLLNVERKWLEGKADYSTGNTEVKRNTLEVRATGPLINIPFLDAGQGVRVSPGESRLVGSNRVADGIFAAARERPLLSVIGGAAVGGILVYGLSRFKALPEVQEAVAMTSIGLVAAFTADSATLRSARGTAGITGDVRFGFKSEPGKAEGFAQLQVEPVLEVQLLPMIASYNSFPLTNAPLELSTVPFFGKASLKGAEGYKTSKGFVSERSGSLALGTKANIATIPLGTPKGGPTQFSIDPFNGTTLDLNKPADKKRWDTMFDFLQPAARVMAQRGSNRKAGAVTVVMTVGRTYQNFGNKNEFYRATAPDGRGGDAFSGVKYGAKLESTDVVALENRTQARTWDEWLFDKSPGFVKPWIDNRTPGQRAISRPVERAGIAQQLKPVEAVAAELNWMAVQHPDKFGQASFVTAERLIAANKTRVSWVDIPQSDGSTRSVAAFREGENIDTTLVAARKGGVMLAESVATEMGPVDLPPGRQRSTHVKKVPEFAAFRFQKYLGIDQLGLQVKLGKTQNDELAVQTKTSTYLVPPEHASDPKKTHDWVKRSIEFGNIKDAYFLKGMQDYLDGRRTPLPGPVGALGKFNKDKNGDLVIKPLKLKVSLGTTENGYVAVQTKTGTYRVPPEHATTRDNIHDWVMRSIELGHIKGAYFQETMSAHLDVTRTRLPGPVGALGKFNKNKDGDLVIQPLKLKVQLGTTENGYVAVQTRTGTYRVPPEQATTLESIRGWVMRSIERGDIKGAYAL